MTTSGNGNGHTNGHQLFAEAPASLTLKVSYRGYDDIQFTLRDASGTALLDKLDTVLNRLEKMGAQPSKASSEAAVTDAPPICPFHGPMKRSNKFAGFYCPKKMGDGSFCKEKRED